MEKSMAEEVYSPRTNHNLLGQIEEISEYFQFEYLSHYGSGKDSIHESEKSLFYI